MDDILCIWTGSEASLQTFHEALNHYHPKLKFSLELGGASINYLDLRISLVTSSATNTLAFDFDIYRKPTNTGQTIHGDSLHHCKHKTAAYTAMAQRLASLPLSPKNIKKEISTISAIAQSNGIKINVSEIVYKRRRAIALKRGSTLNTQGLLSEGRIRWVRFPFLGLSSYRLARILKNYF